jgi:low affinity Fe/Cu permease
MVVLFLIPILILLLVATAPAWSYSKNWGFYPSGGVGAILVLTIVLLFLNRI